MSGCDGCPRRGCGLHVIRCLGYVLGEVLYRLAWRLECWARALRRFAARAETGA